MPNTRHSVGMFVADSLAKQLGAVWHFNQRCLGYVAVAEMMKQQVVILKPKLLMNLNGRSIARTGQSNICFHEFHELGGHFMQAKVFRLFFALFIYATLDGNDGIMCVFGYILTEAPKRVET